MEQEQMKFTEVFFTLVAEYRMMINRISVATQLGMNRDHPDMKKMIHTEKMLCTEVDKIIADFMPNLNEKHPDAAEQVYKKYNIPMA